MIRTQVYLHEQQHRALKRQARASKISMTEALRRAVDAQLQGRPAWPGHSSFRKDAVLSLIGLGASGTGNTSADHDAVLAEALRGTAVR